MNTRVRKMLIESARQNKPLVYSEVMRKIGLDHSEKDDRNKFSKILEDISRFEHSRQRPLLSAQIVYMGTGEIGKKFYWLASELKYGTQKELEARVFEGEMMVICHNFWIDENKFKDFLNDDGNESKAEPSSTILKRTSIPIHKVEANDNDEFSLVGREVDWLRNTEENIKLGNLGEQLVKEYEKEILLSAGFGYLADKVIKVKDGLGYDILSFYTDGKEKYIEVKTTRGNSSTAFFITASEKEFSIQKHECYHLYRLYNFTTEKRPIDFFEIKGDLNTYFKFDAILFQARF